MLFVKYLLMTGGIGMILVAVGILTYDVYLEVHYRRALAAAGPVPLPPTPMRWRTALALALLAWAPLLLAASIVVCRAAWRVFASARPRAHSQARSTLARTS